MVRGAIILAGGPSRRLGRPKAFVEIGGVPLVARVAAVATAVAEEVVIVGRGNSMARLHRAFPLAHVVRDQGHIQSPLVGLLAGAAALRSTYLAALPCDLPFLRPAILRHLFFAAKGHDAAIPRWPDGRIEPLVAVYKREPMSLAAQRALDAGERSNQSMIRRLADVRYVDVARLRSADPHLASFVNVNTPADLVRANELAMRLAPRPRTR